MTPPRLNVYDCRDCQRYLLSKDLDVGVTPFTLPCVCGKTMYSEMYRFNPEIFPRTEVDVEWFKPTAEQVEQLSPRMREHCQNGGLELRPVSSRAVYLVKKFGLGT